MRSAPSLSSCGDLVLKLLLPANTKESWSSANWQAKENEASVTLIRLCGDQGFESFQSMPVTQQLYAAD
jgi:hypothetical protein